MIREYHVHRVKLGLTAPEESRFLSEREPRPGQTLRMRASLEDGWTKVLVLDVEPHDDREVYLLEDVR